MKLPSRLAGLLVLASMAGAASAQDVIATTTNMWEGFYAGVNVGGAWNSTCNTWDLNNVSNPTVVNAFNNRNCPNNGVFVGGVQIGYNFQYDQWVWGFGLDYDYWSAKDHNRSFTYDGALGGPAGTYNFSGKVSPNGFGILGPRIGYAVDNFLPYFRVGGVFTGGSRNSNATFTAAGNTSGVPDAVFSGGKNFKSSGFGVGVGLDVMVADSLFVRGEFTHVSLGKGTNEATSCSPAGSAACSFFGSDAFELNNIHNSFSANIFRVGLNYKFD
jgi:outer membrane immunogenic protein